MWYAWSADGGSTWDWLLGGVLPGTAAAAYEVDPSIHPQTDVFPAITAGKPGQGGRRVAGNERDRTDRSCWASSTPGSCAGPGRANGNPSFYPPTCNWKLHAGQSLNLSAPPRRRPLGPPRTITVYARACRRHLQSGHLLCLPRVLTGACSISSPRPSIPPPDLPTSPMPTTTRSTSCGWRTRRAVQISVPDPGRPSSSS